MDWTKFSIVALIGGVVYFLLGWLIFGIILMDLTAVPDEIAQVVQIPMEEFKMSYMIISCLLMGILHALILMKWAKISTFMDGLKISGLVGGLISLAVGLGMASMFKLNTLDQIGLNAIGDVVASGLTGGIMGWYLGRGK